MILPKNITQIGEINSSCKIYVEDYVVSYIKQINQLAMDKPMAVAVYGIKKEENGVDYLFVYGGAQLDYLCRECRHLSQAQLQEIDRNRKKYFQNYAFLGYCLLAGEMLEGFYIYEQGICRYTAGYARFYEKNDSMLAFMLDNRLTEATPEVVDETKYAMVRNRQEERKRKSEEETRPRQHQENKEEQDSSPLSFQYRFAKAAMAAVFCLVCVLTVTLVSQKGKGDKGLFQLETWKELGQLFSGDVVEEEQELQQAMSSNQVDKLVIEENLNQAILEENLESVSAENSTDVQPTGDTLEGSTGEQQAVVENTTTQDSQVLQESQEASVATESTEPSQESLEATESTDASMESLETIESTEGVAATVQSMEQVVESTEATVMEPVIDVAMNTTQETVYTIVPGDTLIGISTRMYGSERLVAEICELNDITNPDDIKVGEKILLP